MRKDWLWIALASALLAACTNNEQQAPGPQQPAWNGPVVEIGGVEPHYEPQNPATSQDYSVNGKRYHIFKDPSNYSETGLASWYGDEAPNSRTAIGEAFDADALTAAHPTLPLPSYVRVTNLANGRQLVVRVNDRGPYTPGRIIDLSRAAGDRLNISNNTRVKVDYIKVAPDGTLSGPGTLGTRVARQSYALPPRPNITIGTAASTGGIAGSSTSQPTASQQPSPESQQDDNATLSNDDNPATSVHGNGFLGAPQPLPSGVLESREPAAAASAAAITHPAASGPGYVVQVGALSDPVRAREWVNALSKQFGVPGRVDNHGNIYRVQLGHFTSRQQASALQQKLSSEANQSSFITVAPDQM